MSIKQLGKYTLLEELGRGDFGTVYRATDNALDREVALKILHPQLMVDMDFTERFQKEAKLVARFEHPNIVTIYDLGEAEGRVYIAMRYLPGGSLRDRLKKSGPIPFDQALKILRQVGVGLGAAHAKGMVHWDIKPENILFSEEGQAVISDFGLAKAIQVSSSSGGSGVGTPGYRAPELWRGKPPASPATDEYALACVFVEMLTGEQLFSGDTPDEIITKHLVDGAVLPKELPAGGLDGINPILEKALAKDPAARYPGVEDFVAAVDGLEGEAAKQKEATAHQAAVKKTRLEEEARKKAIDDGNNRQEVEERPGQQTENKVRQDTRERDRGELLERERMPETRIPKWIWGILSMVIGGILLGGVFLVTSVYLNSVHLLDSSGLQETSVLQSPDATEAPTQIPSVATEILVPTEAPPVAGQIDTTTKRILFDTTHREWGVIWSSDDQAVVKSLGYQIDFLTMPTYKVMDTYSFFIGKNEQTNFTITTNNIFPIAGVWLQDGPNPLRITLIIGTNSFSDIFWGPNPPYIHPAFFVNSPGQWNVSVNSDDYGGGSYTVIVAGLNVPPVTLDQLRTYSIIWLHNPFNPFLLNEQAALLEYLDMGGTILIVDKDEANTPLSFFHADEPLKTYSATNATIKLYEHGQGRIAWVIPKGNPFLYKDEGHETYILSESEVSQVFKWLENGSR
jgi:hypothetical protein